MRKLSQFSAVYSYLFFLLSCRKIKFETNLNKIIPAPSLRRAVPRVDARGRDELHGAEVGLLEGLARIPAIRRCHGRHECTGEKELPPIRYGML